MREKDKEPKEIERAYLVTGPDGFTIYIPNPNIESPFSEASPKSVAKKPALRKLARP